MSHYGYSLVETTPDIDKNRQEKKCLHVHVTFVAQVISIIFFASFAVCIFISLLFVYL